MQWKHGVSMFLALTYAVFVWGGGAWMLLRSFVG